jgi:hypothetical protein
MRLFSRCLDHSGADEVRSHPFFAGIDWERLREGPGPAQLRDLGVMGGSDDLEDASSSLNGGRGCVACRS